MNYQTIVFDLDGTLVDSLPDIASSFNTVLEQEGYPIHPERQYRNFIGWGLAKTLELALPEGVGETEFRRMLSKVKRRYFDDPMSRSRVYPGIEELLDDVIGARTAVVVYTNKDQDIAESIIAGLLGRFPIDRVLGRSSAYPPKPDPAALLAHMAESPGSPILMVGDSTVDVETADRANIDFAGARWGFGSVDELEAAGSHHNFASPAELHRYLMKKDEYHDE